VTIVRIGERTGGDGDPVDSLIACHQRIRSFLALAARAADEGGAPGEIADACQRIERYFRQAMPLHVADEEDSILPRLRGREAALDRALADMHEQHTAHEAALAAFTAAAAALAADPAEVARRRLLGESGRALEAELAPHLELEEAIIFTAMRRLLSGPELADLAGEIRARRDR
jgi:iron-sulfur cluster repair protein YtfE (RIC family)